MMTYIDRVRQTILGFEGREFFALELPRSRATHSTLAKLEKWGEIKVTRAVPPGVGERPGHKRKAYKAVAINTAGLEETIEEAPPPDLAWRSIWPEFYTPPALTGVTRVHMEDMS